MNSRKIALYVTGGIASYKIPQLVRLFVKNGDEVRVVMTANARRFVTPETLATVSKNHVVTNFEEEYQHDNFIPHIEMAQWADISLIAPATANLIGKLANGITDDIVTSTLIATNKMKMLVPAMNDQMWDSPATQRNLKQLTADGYQILQPATGLLAEGYSGKGRMPEVAEIFKWVNANQQSQQILAGKKILVTAGGTQEPIDPVRYIGNRSSGKMGIEIAKAAQKLGAQVTLVAARTKVPLPTNIDVVKIRTFNELSQILQVNFEHCDALIMAAAVSDYHVENAANQKIKAQKNDEVTITLKRNPNLLKILNKQKKQQVLVGFAAETDHLVENAVAEFADKKIDLLVANDVSRKDIGFGSDQNEVVLFRKNHSNQKIAKTSKQKIAEIIVEETAKLIIKKEEEQN